MENISTVNLAIAEADEVEIYVVDQYGQKALAIFSGSVEAGVYQFELNSAPLATGIYHLILKRGKEHSAVNFIKK